MEKRKFKKISARAILLVFGLILLLRLVSAAAVSIPYNPNFPLTMGPGESKDIEVTIIGEATEKIRVSIINGSEFISSIDSSNEYSLNSGETKIVKFRITIPKSAPEDSQHYIKLNFKDITEKDNEGMVTFNKEMSPSFNIIVKTPPKPAVVETPVVEETPQETKTNIWPAVIVIIVVIVLVIVGIVMYRKHKQ